MISQFKPVVVATAILFAGCSAGGSPSASSAPSSVAAPSSAAAPSQSPSESASPPPSTIQATCPTGEYLLTSLTGTGLNGKKGTLRGGNVTVSFTDGDYVISSDGKQSVSLSTGGQDARLTLKGSVKGTYTGEPAAMTFTTTGATGTAVLSYSGQKRSLSMKQLSNVLAFTGKGAVVCSGDSARLTTSRLTAQLTRQSQ